MRPAHFRQPDSRTTIIARRLCHCQVALLQCQVAELGEFAAKLAHVTDEMERERDARLRGGDLALSESFFEHAGPNMQVLNGRGLRMCMRASRTLSHASAHTRAHGHTPNTQGTAKLAKAMRTFAADLCDRATAYVEHAWRCRSFACHLYMRMRAMYAFLALDWMQAISGRRSSDERDGCGLCSSFTSVHHLWFRWR